MLQSPLGSFRQSRLCRVTVVGAAWCSALYAIVLLHQALPQPRHCLVTDIPCLCMLFCLFDSASSAYHLQRLLSRMCFSQSVCAALLIGTWKALQKVYLLNLLSIYLRLPELSQIYLDQLSMVCHGCGHLERYLNVLTIFKCLDTCARAEI